MSTRILTDTEMTMIGAALYTEGQPRPVDPALLAGWLTAQAIRKIVCKCVIADESIGYEESTKPYLY